MQQNEETSVVLNDNDLLADINLHSRSFPVETDRIVEKKGLNHSLEEQDSLATKKEKIEMTVSSPLC